MPPPTAPTLLPVRPTATVQSRGRSSSIVSVTKIAENYDDVLDGGALTNVNAEWVNYKGAWLIHVVLILVGKILLDILPGLDQDLTWTATNLGYLAVRPRLALAPSRRFPAWNDGESPNSVVSSEFALLTW